jgi:hypothetical protein
MKLVWKTLRWLVVIAGALFLIAQLIRPAKTNPVTDETLTLESHIQLDKKISAILER